MDYSAYGAGYNDEEFPLTTPVDRWLPNATYSFKICIIGDGGTGKSTFINKTINGDFISKYRATQGADSKVLALTAGDNVTVKYLVWDTAGQEKNQGLRDGYYIGAIAGLFFFDVTSRETCTNAKKFIHDFTKACGVENPLIFMIGNKMDMVAKLDDYSKIRADLRKYNTEWFFISAKTGFNLELPFERLTKRLLKDENIMISARGNIMDPMAANIDFLADGGQGQVLPDSVMNYVPDGMNKMGGYPQGQDPNAGFPGNNGYNGYSYQ